ncbi:MAG TPA: response regulator transcription factor [Nocardioides sp.]
MTPAPAEGAPTLRLALLHPQRIWAETLESMLRSWPGIEVVMTHTTYEWTRGAVARGDVDVALVGLDGSGVLPQQLVALREAWPALALVVISDATDAGLIAAIIRAGVRGWVRPSASIGHLVQTLRGARNGETWLPPDVTTALLERLLDAEKTRVASRRAISKLSEREIEILDCLARGMTREEIGRQYRLSPHTVRTHINHVLRKLEVHSTLAAVSLANKSRASL